MRIKSSKRSNASGKGKQMMINFKKMSRQIGYHGQILFKGFIKMLYGAAMAGLIALAIYGYAMIPAEGGYAAVSDFLVCTCLVCIAVGGIYLMGGSGKKEAKK